MYFLKRLIIYVFTILLMISIYKDLSNGMTFFNDSKLDHFQQIYTLNPKDAPVAIAVMVQPGDTLLSITEQINGQTTRLNMEQIMTDFQVLNPHIDPFHLEPNALYYFQKY